MADYRITDLLAATTPLGGTETLEVVQSGYSRKLTLDGILAWSGFLTAVDARVTAGISGGTTPSGPAGGDLAGTYPNPTIKVLSPSPAGTYGSGTAIPVVTVNAKGQVTGVTTVAPTISLTGAVRYDTAQTLSGGEKAQARANIGAQVEDALLNALAGVTPVAAGTLVSWDDLGAATGINLTGSATDVVRGDGSVGPLVGPPLEATRIDDGDSPYAPAVTASMVILVDASSGAVVVNLPEITASHDGLMVIVKARDATNGVTINADAADDIDGSASLTIITTYASWTLVASYDAGGDSYWSVV